VWVPVSYDLTLAVWPLTVIVPFLYPIFLMQEDETRIFLSRMIQHPRVWDTTGILGLSQRNGFSSISVQVDHVLNTPSRCFSPDEILS
jgi:hypothetical protein